MHLRSQVTAGTRHSVAALPVLFHRSFPFVNSNLLVLEDGKLDSPSSATLAGLKRSKVLQEM
jgi:hypothetical protein